MLVNSMPLAPPASQVKLWLLEVVENDATYWQLNFYHVQKPVRLENGTRLEIYPTSTQSQRLGLPNVAQISAKYANGNGDEKLIFFIDQDTELAVPITASATELYGLVCYVTDTPSITGNDIHFKIQQYLENLVFPENQGFHTPQRIAKVVLFILLFLLVLWLAPQL